MTQQDRESGVRNLTDEVIRLIGTDAASAIGKLRVNEIAFRMAQERIAVRAEATAAERERCAKIADAVAAEYPSDGWVAEEIAERIRAGEE